MAKRSKKQKVRSNEIRAKVAGAPAVAPRLPAWLNRDWILGLILVLAVIATYSPVWHAGFIWDDDIHVTTNPCVVGPLGLKEIWTTTAADVYPLTLTTSWLEHALWGLRPLPYHLVNVLMHAGCAVLLWRVLRSLQVPGAWLGAALWALHPVQVESVAWITEMKNTESGLFFLLSTLFFVKWLRTENADGRAGGNRDYALTLLFGVLAMASKSSTVILPVVLCLCAWWMEGRWQWRNLLRVFPFFLMTLAVSAVSIWAVDSHKFSDPRSMPQRIVAAGDAVWFYLGKLLWPHPLIAIYPRWQIDAGRWISYLPLLAVIIVLVILWLKRESRLRPCFFVFAFFLTALLPVLGLVGTPIYQYSLVFDHFQYLPSMGPLSLMGAGMAWLADFVIPKKTWLQSSFCAGLLLILGLLSWQRACAYESEETLWSDTLAKNPNCWLAYNNLGNAFLQKGQMDDAMAQFQEAIKINPGYDASRVNLGNALVKKGQVDDAIAQYQQVLESNPDYAAARDSLGTALFQKGQVDDAVTQYQKALEINPNNAIVHYNLGDAFAQQGKISEAIAQFQTALEINPNYAAARNNLEKAEAITRQSAAQDK